MFNLLLITIKLPWWGWLLLLAGLPTIGAFFAWNNSKESLKKKEEQAIKDAANKLTGKN